jgi:uncharacterized protein (DUF983 family)
MAVNPFVAGFACRCPNCGKGRLFNGYLKVADRCDVCGFDLSAADSGDGPAVFIILIVGCIACFGLLFTEIAYRPPIWVELLVWPIVGAGLCLAMLPPAKGLMLAMQFQNRASEAGGADVAGVTPLGPNPAAAGPAVNPLAPPAEVPAESPGEHER